MFLFWINLLGLDVDIFWMASSVHRSKFLSFLLVFVEQKNDGLFGNEMKLCFNLWYAYCNAVCCERYSFFFIVPFGFLLDLSRRKFEFVSNYKTLGRKFLFDECKMLKQLWDLRIFLSSYQECEKYCISLAGIYRDYY